MMSQDSPSLHPSSEAAAAEMAARLNGAQAPRLNGAQAMIRTLADCGVEVCFANPGTSEMQLVTALDQEPRIRSFLCLFEGVATGAADGYARIAGKPALTLLHLGPGYGNGLANLHNARRAFSPIVNLVGEHATYHRALDAPLNSDIAAIIAPNSCWVGIAEDASQAGPKAAEAFSASFGPPGGSASLIVPADAAWNEGGVLAPAPPAHPVPRVEAAHIGAIAALIKGARRVCFLLNNKALTQGALAAAARLEAAGHRVLADTFVPRMARGVGRYQPGRFLYFAEAAIADLEGFDLLVLVGTQSPVAFFAYPNKPSRLVPEGTQSVTLADVTQDAEHALQNLADQLSAPASGPINAKHDFDCPEGPLSVANIGLSVARHLPDQAIISDDGVTGSLGTWLATAGAAQHDWLNLTGGAIGQGMPVAIGAAIARPASRVLCLTGDGAGMYTIQALWTMARARLPIVTIVFANDAYRILNIEMMRTGAGEPGPSGQGMLSLADPSLDWVKLAEGQGVAAFRATDSAQFDAILRDALVADGPVLIEARIA